MASPVDTSVKFYRDDFPGAPVLNGVAGAAIGLLDACLVTGFGLRTATSVVVSGGVATVTLPSDAKNPNLLNSVILVDGVTGGMTALNGEQRVTAANTATLQFATAVADGTASGAVTIKTAAAGWQALFSGALTNVIALKPNLVEATGCVLRVDDTGTTVARVVGYEVMSDVSTGQGAFPTAAQVSGGMYWPKSDASSAAARAWRVFADDRAVHVWLAPVSSSQGHGAMFSFGDLDAARSGDAYACILAGGQAGVHSTASPIGGCLGYAHAASAGSDMYVARSYTGLGAAQLAKKVSAHNLGAAYSGLAAYNTNNLAYPNPADNSLRLSPLEVLGGAAGLRGTICGVHHTPQIMGEALVTGDIVDGAGAYAGRRLVAVRVGAPGGPISGAGCMFVDVTGPWRI